MVEYTRSRAGYYYKIMKGGKKKRVSKKEYDNNKLEKNCKKKLANKIKINMKEYKDGIWTSPEQAIAVSYSQISQSYPKCKKVLKKKSKKSKK